MATQDEKAAAKQEAAYVAEVSEKFLFGDLQKLIIGEMKLLAAPWDKTPEKEQKKVIDRVKERTEKAVREVVAIIAGKARPTVSADIESVLFKDGVKVTLTFSRAEADRHAIADASGGCVLLVLPDYASALGGEPPKAEKDQRELVPS